MGWLRHSRWGVAIAATMLVGVCSGGATAQQPSEGEIAVSACMMQMLETTVRIMACQHIYNRQAVTEGVQSGFVEIKARSGPGGIRYVYGNKTAPRLCGVIFVGDHDGDDGGQEFMEGTFAVHRRALRAVHESSLKELSVVVGEKVGQMMASAEKNPPLGDLKFETEFFAHTAGMVLAGVGEAAQNPALKGVPHSWDEETCTATIGTHKIVLPFAVGPDTRVLALTSKTVAGFYAKYSAWMDQEFETISAKK